MYFMHPGEEEAQPAAQEATEHPKVIKAHPEGSE